MYTLSVGCLISQEEHDAFISSLKEEEDVDKNSHYVRFNGENSCIEFEDSGHLNPLFQGSWAMSFLMTDSLPPESQHRSLFEVGGTTLSLLHSRETIELLRCEQVALAVNECVEFSVSLEEADALQIDDRVTISYKSDEERLILFRNTESLINVTGIQDVYSSSDTFRFGCTDTVEQNPWSGGIDSMILFGGAFHMGVLMDLIDAETSGPIAAFLEEQSAHVSYWSLGEDEYPSILDAMDRWNGTADNIIFVER